MRLLSSSVAEFFNDIEIKILSGFIYRRIETTGHEYNLWLVELTLDKISQTNLIIKRLKSKYFNYFSVQ